MTIISVKKVRKRPYKMADRSSKMWQTWMLQTRSIQTCPKDRSNWILSALFNRTWCWNRNAQSHGKRFHDKSSSVIGHITFYFRLHEKTTTVPPWFNKKKGHSMTTTTVSWHENHNNLESEQAPFWENDNYDQLTIKYYVSPWSTTAFNQPKYLDEFLWNSCTVFTPELSFARQSKRGIITLSFN